MKLGSTALVAFLLLPLAASAQNTQESVTVTGQSPQTRTDIMRGFIRSYVPQSTISGKLARWIDPICPLVIGLKPEENMAVSARIEKDARAVGARVQARQPCRPNVIIVFAQDPQDLTTKIATQHWSMAKILLGDVDGPMHARKVSKITAPIQAWYGTGVQDMEGRRAPNDCWPTRCELIGKASYLGDGIKSFFSNVFVVVDLSKVAGRQIGTIADYAAMLTLTQTNAFATCRNMPSITNLLLPDCGLKTTALSDADLAFMRGVYKANGGDRINLQIGDILREMEKSPADLEVKAPASQGPADLANHPAREGGG